MAGLTPKEQKALNDISRARNPKAKLGDMVHNLSGKTKFYYGTPNNSAYAKILLKIQSAAQTADFHHKTVTVNNPSTANPGADVYEFLADYEQVKTSPGNIAVNISDDAAKHASATFSFGGTFDIGSIYNFGGIMYTLVADGTADSAGEVNHKETEADTISALYAAINGTDLLNTPNPLIKALSKTTSNMVVAARVGGASGNEIVMGGATVTGGIDCDKVTAYTLLSEAIEAHGTQGVWAQPYDSAGGETPDSLKIEATDIGAKGNLVTVATTLDNAFLNGVAYLDAPCALSGGKSATELPGPGFMYDDEYMYFFVEDEGADDGLGVWCKIAYTEVM